MDKQQKHRLTLTDLLSSIQQRTSLIQHAVHSCRRGCRQKTSCFQAGQSRARSVRLPALLWFGRSLDASPPSQAPAVCAAWPAISRTAGTAVSSRPMLLPRGVWILENFGQLRRRNTPSKKFVRNVSCRNNHRQSADCNPWRDTRNVL